MSCERLDVFHNTEASLRAVMASLIVFAGLLPGVARAADPAADSLAWLASGIDGASPNISTTQSGAPIAARATASTSYDNQSGVSTNPNNNTTQPPLLEGAATPNSGPPRLGLFTGFGTTLVDNGIDVHGLAFDHFYANPQAGNITGQTNNLAVFAPSVDLDLQRILGIPGGNIHSRLIFFGLRSNIPGIITDGGGFLVADQTTPAPSTTQDVISLLTYEQKLLDDKLSIEVGRTNVYRYFLLPNSIDEFTYRSSTFAADGDFPSVPFPTWGGIVNYHFTPKWYVQGGIFQENTERAIVNPNIFGTAFSTGFQSLAEIAYRSEFYNAAYPANLEAGVEGSTRHGYAIYNNVKGGIPIATSRDEATDYPGGGVFFFQGQKILWRGDRRPDGPPPNIALYGSADASFDKPQPVDLDAEAGLNFTGFIPGRPFDAVGIQARYQRLSAIEANFETRLQDHFAGPGPRQSRDGYAFEVVANFQGTPWLAIRPSIQYDVDPDNLFDPAQPRRPSDGFVAALSATVSLGRLLGTSNKPF